MSTSRAQEKNSEASGGSTGGCTGPTGSQGNAAWTAYTWRNRGTLQIIMQIDHGNERSPLLQ